MSSDTRQLVFLVGAAGSTGSTIARALASQPQKFGVKALTRPSSVDKPSTQELKSLGVEVVVGDVVSDSQETLETHLKGIDTVIIAAPPVGPEGQSQQHNLLLAAKKAGVKRVVPSDFGPHGVPGSTVYNDLKLQTRRFMIENSIPYTFIQVGGWSSGFLPYPHSVEGGVFGKTTGKQFHGPGNVKAAYTALERVGDFVARIISDPRTLNQAVQIWDGETTLEEAWKIGSQITGENFDDYPRLSAEELEARVAGGEIVGIGSELMRSVFVRGESTVEKAVAAGALDARMLYPDYIPLSLEEFARNFYSDYSKITL